MAGGVLGYTSSAIQERRRERRADAAEERNRVRDDRLRFEARQFDAYVALTAAANRVYAVVKHPALVGDAILRADTYGARSIQLSSAFEDFNATLSPCFLLSTSDGVKDAVANLASAVRHLIEGVAAPEVEGDQIPSLLHSHREAVKRAELAMRAEFGLKPRIAGSVQSTLRS